MTHSWTILLKLITVLGYLKPVTSNIHTILGCYQGWIRGTLCLCASDPFRQNLGIRTIRGGEDALKYCLFTMAFFTIRSIIPQTKDKSLYKLHKTFVFSPNKLLNYLTLWIIGKMHHLHGNLNYIDYLNYRVILFGGDTQCSSYIMKMSYSIKQNHLCFMMSKQPIELLLVKMQLLSRTFLQYVTPNSNTHWLRLLVYHVSILFMVCIVTCQLDSCNVKNIFFV